MQKGKIRILLVEDHPLYRVGLHMALSYSGLDCVLKSEAVLIGMFAAEDLVKKALSPLTLRQFQSRG